MAKTMKKSKIAKTAKKMPRCPAGSHRSGSRCMSNKPKCGKGTRRSRKTGKCTRKK